MNTEYYSIFIAQTNHSSNHSFITFSTEWGLTKKTIETTNVCQQLKKDPSLLTQDIAFSVGNVKVLIK